MENKIYERDKNHREYQAVLAKISMGNEIYERGENTENIKPS